jgi:hypothetical protein
MKKEEVIKLIGKERWKEFLKWMYGQTIGINADGTLNFYKTDVDRFIDGREVVD